MNIEPAVSAEQSADLVRQLYRAFLQREAGAEDIALHGANLQGGAGLAAVLGIIHSPEATEIRRQQAAAPSKRSSGTLLALERADLAEVVARTLAAVRRDPPSTYEVELRIDDVGRGTPLATVLGDALDLREGSIHPDEDRVSIDAVIEVMYRLALGRVPGDIDMDVWRGAAASQGRLSDVVVGISESAEARALRAPLDIAPGVKVQLAFEIILGRGASAAEVDSLRGPDGGTGLDVAPLVWQLFANEARRRLQSSATVNNPYQAYIFGSRGLVSVSDWRSSAGLETPIAGEQTALGQGSVMSLRQDEGCAVSIVTSLYRGGAFIRSFLENITAQTIFRTHCELIIIDAASPENEASVIAEFCEQFPNIVYRRMDSRIGIYEAWNIGVGLARGRYITNANLDDSRRVDSLEIQAATLDTFDFIDVTYQDVLYSFEPALPFGEIASRGFQTDLPLVSRYNLMEFNHPHNAPMWRASLHRDVGLFNQTLQSAADYEFWLRCRAQGKVFYKINDPHAAYFINPNGISTRPDTRGVSEANAVSHNLFRKLISPMLVMSDEDFLMTVDAISSPPLRTGRRYDIIQSALVAVGAERGSEA